MYGPMTMLVVGVLGLLFVVGVALIRRSMRDEAGLGGKAPCPHCSTRNPRRAHYCGNCGKSLI